MHIISKDLERLNLDQEVRYCVHASHVWTTLPYEKVVVLQVAPDEVNEKVLSKCVNLQYLSCPNLTQDFDYTKLPASIKHLRFDDLIVDEYKFPSHVQTLLVKRMNCFHQSLFHLKQVECQVKFYLYYRQHEHPSYAVRSYTEQKIEHENLLIKNDDGKPKGKLLIQAHLSITFSALENHIAIHANQRDTTFMLIALKNVPLFNLKWSKINGLELDYLHFNMIIPESLSSLEVHQVCSNYRFNDQMYINHLHIHSCQYALNFNGITIEELWLNDYTLPIDFNSFCLVDVLILEQYNHAIASFPSELTMIQLPNYAHEIPAIPKRCRHIRIGK